MSNAESVSWAETVAGAETWTLARQITELCNEPDWPDVDGLDQLRYRAIWVCEDLASRRGTPEAISETSLQRVSDDLRQLVSTLTRLRSESATSYNTPAYLSQARTAVDAALDDAAGWPPADRVRLSQQFSEAVAVYKSDLNKTIKDARSSLNESKARVADALEEASTASDELATKAAELAANLTNLEQRVDSAVSEVAASAAAAEKERDRTAQEQQTKLVEDAQETLAAIRDVEGQARKLVESIAGDATATSYATYARDQSKAANLWRMIAVGLILLSIGPFVWAALAAADSGWHGIVGRLAVGAAVAAAGAFAARQSGEHRQQERKARALELGLVAIGPYLADVDDKDKIDQTKLDMARQLFIEDEEANRAENGLVPTSVLTSAIAVGQDALKILNKRSDSER